MSDAPTHERAPTAYATTQDLVWRSQRSLERSDEARARLGVDAGRPRPVLGELSAEARAARAPLRPEELVGAQHDRVHRDPGRARAARAVRKEGTG